MAELVGEAYVRIHADTRFMERAIRRDMAKIGKEGADSLLANFDATLRQSASARLKNAQRQLADAITGGDFDVLLRKSGKSIEDFVDDISADLTRLANNSKVKFTDVNVALESLDKWAEEAKLTRALKEQEAEFDANWKAAIRLNAELDRQEKLGSDLAAMYSRMDTDATRAEIKKLRDEFVRQEKAIDDAHAAALRYNKTLKASEVPGFNAHLTGLRRSVAVINRDLQKISVAGGIGVIFGRGSRNNFLNFIGSMARNLTLLGETVIRFPFIALDKMFTGFDNVVSAFVRMRANGDSILKIIGTGLGSAAKAGIPGLIALAGSAFALTAILPALASAASLAAAGLTAIAAALSFALAGSLLPLLPVVVALGAGIGILALGVAELTDASRRQKEEMQPLIKAWQDLRKEFEPLADRFAHEVGHWGEVVQEITPFIGKLGETMLANAEYFRKGLQSPEMDRFFKAWGESLPKILADLGSGFTHLTRGLIEFFTPILPYAERLADNFDDAMRTFDAWTSSAGGETAIKNFFEDAFLAAESFWRSVKNVGVAIGNILGIGQSDAGSGFLTWLEEITGAFRDFTEDPEGQNSLKQWFEDAMAAGSTLMGIIGELGKMFDTLDSPTARQDLQTFLDTLQTFAGAAETIAEGINFVSAAFRALNPASLLASVAASGALTTIQTALMDFYNWVTSGFGLADAMDDIGRAIVAPFKWAWEQLFGSSYIPDIVNGFSQWMPRIPGIITGALNGVEGLMTAPFRAGRTVLTQLLSLLPGDVGSRLSSAAGRIPGALSGVAGALTSPFSQGRAQVITTLVSTGGSIYSTAAGWASRARSAVSGIPGALSGAFETARRTISGIMSEIATMVGRIPGIRAAATGAVSFLRSTLNPVIDTFNRLPGPDLPRLAAGGFTKGPSLAGEAGAEVVIPLNRPLSMIDPSVRDLAAMIRGFTAPTQAQAPGKVINVHPGAFNIMVPNADPALVAEAVFDRIVGFGD